ncbi:MULTISPECIES: 30S ribosomal protein S20 [Nitrosomonas]|uniref:Small ribosomal subunit protein bS20 n=1 Tax=Nitrosomonas communis TaxID=44574 RepID=A0A0F7KJN4_9PROT|nr:MULTISPECIES: 30S ribosomal protein S20 [Nitrosomonas]AKH39012.1 30S ribosomal protein S20 [Nitrosomonas communis]TYP80018.1 small subunit ribosomal protein S20 [Nitrosomonas communis]UVS61172.1 30S ribosomal protein S20 [Nitrosomonas sp. PLL12]
MANTAQAKKRARQTVVRREENFSLRSRMRTAIKSIRKAIESGDKELAETVFKKSTSVLDSIANKGIIHKNKAARHKSRLASSIKAMV